MREQGEQRNTPQKTGQVGAESGNHAPVNQGVRDFTDRDKAILRGLILDLIFDSRARRKA